MTIFLLAFLLFLMGQAEAATYYVKKTSTNSTTCASATSSTGNNPVNTFGKGLQCMTAGAGDTLYLMADGVGGTATYTEDLYNAGIVPPSGTSGAHTTIRTYGTDTIRFTHQSSLNFYNGNFSYVDFIGGCTTGLSRVCKLIWDGGSNAANVPIAGSNLAWSNDGTPSHHLIFDGVRVTGWGWGTSDSGFNQRLNDSIIRNSRIDNNGNDSLKSGYPGYGFYISPTNTTIENNEIDHNGNYGFHQHSSDGHSSTGTIFRYNVVHDNIQTPPTSSQASGQVLIGSYCSGAEVYGNLIYGPVGQYGLRVDYACNGTKVYNNTIYGATVAGIDLAQAPGGAANTLITNNITSNISLGAATNTILTQNLCSSGSVNCAYSESTNVTFINAATANFTIKAGSLAINAGINLGAPYNSDVANVARPASPNPWDLGALEYAAIAPPVSQLVLALPLDEGSGSVGVDVSGQKNNASLVGGATWDNAGKYGKAVMFDGTGYLNISASASLALASGMTLEAWVYPTTSTFGFTAIIRHERYYLYAASDAGYCPAVSLAPIGGYATPSDNFICATSLPPLNQWSHLAITHDGATLTFYLDGNPLASRTSTDPMTPSSFPLTIGASQFGENFIGKIDEPRVYNYARNPSQIVSDMNTPLIGGPGKYVDIAAPASVEISSARSIEISAD